MPLINNKSDETKLKKAAKKQKEKKLLEKIFRESEEDKLKIKNAKNQN